MTKTFEEELFNKVPCKFELTTEAEYKKSTLINHFKNWHSDEEFQELFDKYSNINDNYEKEVIRSSKLESQITGLKSQLQQQALPKTVEDFQGELEDLIDDILDDDISDSAFDGKKYKFIEKYAPQAMPVVPECVAKVVELLKKNPETPWSKLYEALGEEGVTWLNEFQHKDERFGFGGLNSKLIVLFHLAINGYQVEKPQKFYLKNKLTGFYLFKAFGGKYGEEFYRSTINLTDDFKFAKEEIDNMETGSYEQIKAEKEK